MQISRAKNDAAKQVKPKEVANFSEIQILPLDCMPHPRIQYHSVESSTNITQKWDGNGTEERCKNFYITDINLIQIYWNVSTCIYIIICELLIYHLN